MHLSLPRLLWLTPLLHLSTAITVDPSSKDSLASASKTMIEGMLAYYGIDTPGAIPGIFNSIQNYYWWMAGAAWNSMMQYWWLTGDSEYNDLVMEAMLFQVGADQDYMPANQTHSEGNDDQCFWGLAAMSAAELNFPNPPKDQPQWLALAQAVFNEQMERWDPADCGGGLRWQIFPFNAGYDYKNSISNGCLFHLGARLARYTGNDTYVQYCNQIFDWLQTVGMLTSDWSVYDGAEIPCTSYDLIQWTYNNGQLLSGSAYLYNYTNGDPTWKTRLQSLLSAASERFFLDGVLWEPACEQNFNCDNDQFCFKGFLAQYMATATQLASFTADTVFSLLATSATAVGNHCNQGTNNTQCTMWWTSLGASGPATLGVGQQMSALNVFNGNLLKFMTSSSVATSTDGGSSIGNPNAGSSSSDRVTTITPATTGDKALAGILTAVFSIGGCGFAAWLAL